MDRLTRIIDWLKVVLRAAPTWIALALAVLTLVLTQLEAEGLTEAARWVALAIGWLTAAGNIVRRVTPVAANERGVLPR